MISSFKIYNFSLVLVSQFAGPSLSFIFLLLMARVESVEVYGIYFHALAYASLVHTFSDLGLKDYFIRWIKYGSSSNRRILPAFSALYFSLFSFLFLFFLFLINFIESDSEDILELYVLLSIDFFMVGVVSKIVYVGSQFGKSLHVYAKIELISRISSVLLKVSFYIASEDLVLSLYVGLFVNAIVILSVFRSYNELGLNPFFISNFKLLFCILKNFRSWFPFTLNFLALVLGFGVERIVVGNFFSPSVMGLFSSVLTVMVVGQILVNVIWVFIIPNVYNETLKFSYGYFIFVLSVLGFSVSLITIFSGYVIYNFVYNKDLLSGMSYLIVFSWYFLFRVLNLGNEAVLISNEKLYVFSLIKSALAVFSLLMMPFFGSLYGLYAVISQMVLFECLVFVFNIVFININKLSFIKPNIYTEDL